MGTIQGVKVVVADKNSHEHGVLGVRKTAYNNPAAQEALNMERRALRHSAKIPHPNLQRLLCKSAHGVLLPLATGSLHETLKERSPPLSQKLSWLHQMGSGLAHLHNLGYLHLDLKAQNVLINFEGQAVLSDLGGNVRETVKKGYVGYVVPEPYADISELSDVYGYACMLVEIITGVKVTCTNHWLRDFPVEALRAAPQLLIDALKGKADGREIQNFSQMIKSALSVNPENRPKLSLLTRAVEGLRCSIAEYESERVSVKIPAADYEQEDAAAPRSGQNDRAPRRTGRTPRVPKIPLPGYETSTVDVQRPLKGILSMPKEIDQDYEVKDNAPKDVSSKPPKDVSSKPPKVVRFADQVIAAHSR